MKKYIILSFLVLMPFIGTGAQTVRVFDIADVALRSWEEVGDSARLSLSLTLSGEKLPAQKQVDIVPVVGDGVHRMTLPVVSLMGGSRYKSYVRYLDLGGRTSGFPDDPAFVLKTGVAGGTKSYVAVVPLEDWMRHARLTLESSMCRCGVGAGALSSSAMADSLTNRERVVVREIVSPGQTVKLFRCELALDFRVNRCEISPQYGHNVMELKRVDRLMDEVLSSGRYSIDKICIVGYASPEGPYDNNERLSKCRAASLADLMAEKYGLSRERFSTRFGGENWDGLIDVLGKSDYYFKDAMLDIIRGNTEEAARKSALKSYENGVPYRVLLKEVYPWLRRAEVIIEAREIIK